MSEEDRRRFAEVGGWRQFEKNRDRTKPEGPASLEEQMKAELKHLAVENAAELLLNPLAWAFYNAGRQVIERMGSRITDLENQVHHLTP